MELNYYDKLYKFLSGGSSNRQNKPKDKEFFHVDCKVTKKKVCNCKLIQPQDLDQKLSETIDFLLKEDFSIQGGAIKWNQKPLNSTIDETIMRISPNSAKQLLSRFEGYPLGKKDYSEMEKEIKDNKKICENCKRNIYDNDFHKGWKNNETGEYALLCSTCSKKYFNGALEMRFESNPVNSRRSDEYITSAYRKFDQPVHKTPSFHVITQDMQSMLDKKRQEGNELTCSLPKCGRTGKKTDFLQCGKCTKPYHFGCLGNPTLVYKFVSRFRWFCSDCRNCAKCVKPIDVESLHCSACDRVFHGHCTAKSKSLSGFFCEDCSKCKNCEKDLECSNSVEALFVKGVRVCTECWKMYKNKHYCPKCFKVYTHQQDINSIYCRKCLYYFHAECEGISIEELREKNRQKYSYTCSVCRTMNS